ncbi:hypothetical protein EZJ49_04545 [Bdellovibrio bacteriovorus]|uniref:hypothetical protein n=1 Tax=Bdellovibrio bacteriovorus TaxID=959 RepID=UPI0021CF6A5A|nr:hypothetical protein [Bdellovibrio bacteriovorus]UXR65522.1 hypothetical protein EZJ49_04545 [Bdellovibrio bacteriovorus]
MNVGGVPANLWDSFDLSTWNEAAAGNTISLGPTLYGAPGTASTYPTLDTAPFSITSSHNLKNMRKIAAFTPNGKFYFMGSSGNLDESDLWIFESDTTAVKPVAGGSGPVNYVASDHGGVALGAYLTDVYGMQSNADGDLLIFDGWRLRKVTVTTEAATPKIYDEVNFLSFANRPNVDRWTHAVYDAATGWSYFAVTKDVATDRRAQVWAARQDQGFVEIPTTGLVLSSDHSTARKLNLAITPLGLLLLDAEKKRVLATPLKPLTP